GDRPDDRHADARRDAAERGANELERLDHRSTASPLHRPGLQLQRGRAESAVRRRHTDRGGAHEPALQSHGRVAGVRATADQYTNADEHEHPDSDQYEHADEYEHCHAHADGHGYEHSDAGEYEHGHIHGHVYAHGDAVTDGHGHGVVHADAGADQAPGDP